MCAQVQAKIDDLFKKSNQMMLFYTQTQAVEQLFCEYASETNKRGIENRFYIVDT